MQRFTIASSHALPPGKATVRFEFACDGGGPGKGGQGTLLVNGQKVAEGRIEHTQAGMFSANETADVGIDLGTPVVEAISSEERSRFTGRIVKATVEVIAPPPATKAAGDAAAKDARQKIDEVPAAPSMPVAIEAASIAVYQPGIAGGVLVETMEVSAKVTAIDKASRNVSLMRTDGTSFTVQAGPDAVNFDQVQVGDTVSATLTGELMAFVAAEGEDVRDETTARVRRAKKGEQPGGEAVATTRRVGTVVGLDHFKRQVTLQFADGSVETFPVWPDVNLEAHKVGDKVVFEATEKIAVTITKR